MILYRKDMTHTFMNHEDYWWTPTPRSRESSIRRSTSNDNPPRRINSSPRDLEIELIWGDLIEGYKDVYFSDAWLTR